MPKLPFNISKVMDAWKEASATATGAADLMLAGDEQLVKSAQERFSVGGAIPVTWSRSLTELASVRLSSGEVLVLLVKPEQEAGVLDAIARPGSGVSGGRVVLAVDEGVSATRRTTYPAAGCSRLSFSDTPAAWRRLFELCTDGEGAVALGRRYPTLRPAAARRVVYRSAGQNALIGLAFFLPGADMPAMTLNQAKMVLSLAGIHGEEIGRERALELVAVAGAGYASRALTRSLLKSNPTLSLAIKTGMGFIATTGLGLAAIKYFEKGAPAATSRVVALAGSFRR